MKRNNIFMWAYITFIGISIILRIFLNYAIWNPIVIAITISSMFFAFEDLFHLLYQTQKKSCDMTENFIFDAKKKKEPAIMFFSKLDNKAAEYEGTRYDLTKLQKQAANEKTRLEEIIELLNQLDELNEKDRKKEKRLKVTSQSFAYAGFLLLFVSMIACTLISVPQIVQEILTVLSFAIILITQQINNIAVDKIQKENKRNSDLMQKFNEEYNEWTKVTDRFNDVIATIEKKSSMEVLTNAN